MKISDNALEVICRYEGFMSVPYICAGGHKTIGYGHVIKWRERFPNPITKEEALVILREDVRIAENAVLKLIKRPLTQGQFDALVSFTFNLGSGALQRSTLRRVIQRGEYSKVPHEFRKWVYAGGKKLRGLLRRREAEIRLFLGNTVIVSEP